MEISVWRIYYSDGSSFSSEDGEPSDAPINCVQVIVEKVNGRTLQHSIGDYYGWDGIMWEVNNIVQPSWKVTLVGSMMKPEEFKKIRAEAMAWLDQLC